MAAPKHVFVTYIRTTPDAPWQARCRDFTEDHDIFMTDVDAVL